MRMVYPSEVLAVDALNRMRFEWPISVTVFNIVIHHEAQTLNTHRLYVFLITRERIRHPSPAAPSEKVTLKIFFCCKYAI
jgi:hypothetical protein